MAHKPNKPTRREQREQRRQEKAVIEEQQRAAAQQRQRWLVLIAIASGGIAFGIHEAGGPGFFVGFTLLAGAGIFLAVALGGLGGAVKPRDRTKGSNIDYGK